MLASLVLCFLPAEGLHPSCCFSSFLQNHQTSCSVRPDPALAARVGRAALSPRSCSKMRDLSLFSQQAWPTGTQQILIPSSWQQVPGVAIHSSAHQSAVAESPLETHDGSSQQGHIWRSVDWTLHTQEPRWFPAVMSG